MLFRFEELVGTTFQLVANRCRYVELDHYVCVHRRGSGLMPSQGYGTISGRRSKNQMMWTG